MIIDDYSFHDSEIFQVAESSDQTIDFFINFATDWQNNLFEKRILRFKDVINYHVDEMPFTGQITILKIVNLGNVMKIFGVDRNQIQVLKNKIDMQTNAGRRIIEYSACELLKP